MVLSSANCGKWRFPICHLRFSISVTSPSDINIFTRGTFLQLMNLYWYHNHQGLSLLGSLLFICVGLDNIITYISSRYHEVFSALRKFLCAPALFIPHPSCLWHWSLYTPWVYFFPEYICHFQYTIFSILWLLRFIYFLVWMYSIIFLYKLYLSISLFGRDHLDLFQGFGKLWTFL